MNDLTVKEGGWGSGPWGLTQLLQVGQVSWSALSGGMGWLQASLLHDTLADVTQCVGNLTCRSVTLEYVTHVHACHAVTCYVGKVPANNIKHLSIFIHLDQYQQLLSYKMERIGQSC